jgi:2,3-dihydroxybenzoate-AMP ligase
MLPGVVPFPPEYAARYRARGYWQDKSLAQEFEWVFRTFSARTALVDGERAFTYEDIDRHSRNLALNLLELGLKPLDRVVPALPNVAEFVILYFALQKIGAIPIAALVTHRFAEISQFVQLSGASACVYPERQGDFEFEPMIRRVQGENACLRHCISLARLRQLIEKPAQGDLSRIRIDPTDPCIFQLSGGTTGIPKLIPRTHNDYAYNSRTAAPVCGVTADSVLLLALPIAHNLPLACPGIQGYFFQGGKVVLSPTTR